MSAADSSPSGQSQQPSPPAPPPLPSPQNTTKPSFPLKVLRTPEEHFIPSIMSTTPPTGFYFFYGTLMDPLMLKQLLNLDELPELRPARIKGFASKLWGPYPALVQSTDDSVIEGVAYDVQSTDHGARLAYYETNNYTPKSCEIIYTDEKEPQSSPGYAFVFAGHPTDLRDGKFDSKAWLERDGRSAG